MALSPKSLFSRGLIKDTLGNRGVRLETDGLIGRTGGTELPTGVAYLYGMLHPFIHRLRSRIHRGA